MEDDVRRRSDYHPGLDAELETLSGSPKQWSRQPKNSIDVAGDPGLPSAGMLPVESVESRERRG